VTYRPDREKNGYCRIMYRNGKTQDVKRNEYEPLLIALRAKTDPLYEAVDLYGDALAVVLEEVCGVGDCSPAALAAFEVDAEEEAAHKKTHGED